MWMVLGMFSHLIQFLRQNVTPLYVLDGEQRPCLVVFVCVCVFSFFPTPCHLLGNFNFSFLNVPLTCRLPICTGGGEVRPSKPAPSGSFLRMGKTCQAIPEGGGGRTVRSARLGTRRFRTTLTNLLLTNCFQTIVFWPNVYLFFLPGRSHTHAHIRP